MKKSQLGFYLVFAIGLFVMPTIVLAIAGSSGEAGSVILFLLVFYLFDIFFWKMTIDLIKRKILEKKIYLNGEKRNAKFVSFKEVGAINEVTYYKIKYSYQDRGTILTEDSTDMFRRDFIEMVKIVNFFPIMVYRGKSAICKNFVGHILNEFRINKSIFDRDFDEDSANLLYEGIEKKYGYVDEIHSERYVRTCKYCGCQFENGKSKCSGCGASDYKIEKY